MYLTYVDEVKYDAKQEPYYWLCGLAISDDEIRSIEDSLDAIAENYFGTAELDPSTEFHATQIVQGKGPYKGHDVGKRVDLFKSLADVIAGHPTIGRIEIRLDPSKMRRNDYQPIAFMYLVERVNFWTRKKKSLALLIADHDKQFVNTNVRSLSRYKTKGTEFEYGREITHVVDTVHHTHSHHSRLLQLADLYTYSKSLIAKAPDKYPKSKIYKHITKITHFAWPSAYKHWPSDWSRS